MNDLTPTTSPATPATRQTIALTKGELHRWVDEAWSAILAANDDNAPDVLIHGDDPVGVDSETGRIAPYTRNTLRERMSVAAEFARFKQDRNGNWSSQPVTPPTDLAPIILDWPEWKYGDAPRLARVTRVPVLTREGTIIDRPGYHRAFEILYAPPPELRRIRVPRLSELTITHVRSARDFLLGPDGLGEFGFADPDADAIRARPDRRPHAAGVRSCPDPRLSARATSPRRS